MFVNYYGIKHNKMKMISLIPKGRAPYFKNGKMYAADPMVEFVGNPKSKHGFGIFHPPFVAMLEKWFGKRVQNITGSDFDILLNLVQEGHPILFWISIPNWRGLSKVTNGPTWITDKTNRKFTWLNSEHAAVLVGYTKNREKILINDPYTGRLLTLPYSIVKDRYEALEKQAIYLKEEKTGSLYKGVFSLNTKNNKEIQLIHLDDRYYLGSKAISLLTKNTENPIQVSEKKDGFLFKKVDKKKVKGEALKNKKKFALVEDKIKLSYKGKDITSKGVWLGDEFYFLLDDLGKILKFNYFQKEKKYGLHLIFDKKEYFYSKDSKILSYFMDKKDYKNSTRILKSMDKNHKSKNEKITLEILKYFTMRDNEKGNLEKQEKKIEEFDLKKFKDKLLLVKYYFRSENEEMLLKTLVNYLKAHPEKIEEFINHPDYSIYLEDFDLNQAIEKDKKEDKIEEAGTTEVVTEEKEKIEEIEKKKEEVEKKEEIEKKEGTEQSERVEKSELKTEEIETDKGKIEEKVEDLNFKGDSSFEKTETETENALSYLCAEYEVCDHRRE